MIKQYKVTKSKDATEFSMLVDAAKFRGIDRKTIAERLGISQSSVQKKRAGHTRVLPCEVESLRNLVEEVMG